MCGIAIIDGAVYLLGTDEEEDEEYYVSRLDVASSANDDLALVPFRARGLAWDGSRFWTNHREEDRTVTFAAELKLRFDHVARESRRANQF